MRVNGVPQPLQEAVTTLNAIIRPLQRLFRWSGEHHEEAHGIGAVFLEQCLGVDSIALGLRHFGAVLVHHALRQQVGEWLIRAGQPDIAHQFLEKARV